MLRFVAKLLLKRCMIGPALSLAALESLGVIR
jgi:hypothetical protein